MEVFRIETSVRIWDNTYLYSWVQLTEFGLKMSRSALSSNHFNNHEITIFDFSCFFFNLIFLGTQFRVRIGYGILEKLWNFEKEIPFMEKLWNLSKMAVPMEKLWNFCFGGKKCVLSFKKMGGK